MRPRHLAGAALGVALAGWGSWRLASLVLPLLAGGACLAVVAWDLTRKDPS